jgi:uncharacterized membrane protein (DUF106 family)
MVLEMFHPSVSVVLISIVMLLVINAAYRIFVNQDRAAELKERIRVLSKEARANPGKANEIMKETMSQQREMMKMNMKPMLASFVIVAILLPYLALTFHDIDVLKTASDFQIGDKNHTFAFSDKIAQIDGEEYNVPCKLVIGDRKWEINDAGDKVRLSLVVAEMPAGIPLIGGWELGWIWWYILASIPFAIIVRVAYGIRN